MAVKNLVISALIVFFGFNFLKNVKAQDTYGPVCDDVTVPCTPTETPTATPTPTLEATPTETPTETPIPEVAELPRAGSMDKLHYLLVISLSLILAGSVSSFALAPKK